MFKLVLTLSALLAIFGCSTLPNSQNRLEHRVVINSAHSTQVTLSHIKAYLLLGNIEKAEQLFQYIEAPKPNAQIMLLQAELHAAKGNSIDAQTAFLSALEDDQYDVPLDKVSVPTDLLDFFCSKKKWPALNGYGKAFVNSEKDNGKTLTENKIVKNKVFTQIGLCSFYQQRWDDTRYWLEKVDLDESVTPLTYLALARANIERELFTKAQNLITQYEQKKVTVDPQSLWAAIEVYLALKQPELVTQLGENMRALFPFNEFTRNYILLTKRDRLQTITGTPIESATSVSTSPTPTTSKASVDNIHTMKKGETLYQLSKRYGVTTPELMSWNPNLVITDISIGTQIRITPIR